MNKLHDLFLALPETDRRALRTWLTAPHLKVREDVLRLYEYVFKGGSWGQTDRFRCALWRKKYHDDTLWHTQSLLVKAIERYVTDTFEVSVTPEVSAARTAYRLAQAYHKLGAENLFLQAFRQYKTAENAQKTQNADSLHLRAEAERLWFLQTTDKQRTTDTNLQTILEAQEKYFAAAQLKMVCTAISYQNINKNTYDFGLLAPLLERLMA